MIQRQNDQIVALRSQLMSRRTNDSLMQLTTAADHKQRDLKKTTSVLDVPV